MNSSMRIMTVSLLTILLGFSAIAIAPSFAASHESIENEMEETADSMDESMDEAEDKMDESMDEAEDKMEDAMDEAEDKMEDTMAEQRQDINEAMKEQREQMKERKDAMKDEWKDHNKMSDYRMAPEAMKAQIMDKITKYCAMTDEEREQYKMDHAKEMSAMNEEQKQMHEKMCDMSPEEISQYLDDHPELIPKKLKYHKMGVTADYHKESMEKFRAMHQDLTEEQIMEMKEKMRMKYDENKDRLHAKFQAMSDVHKQKWMAKYDEMRQYSEDRAIQFSEMPDDQKAEYKQKLKDELRMKYKDWLSPRKQMQMGISSDEIICKEGMESVVRNSNGAVLCVHPMTASKMIERGFAIPAI